MRLPKEFSAQDGEKTYEIHQRSFPARIFLGRWEGIVTRTSIIHNREVSLNSPATTYDIVRAIGIYQREHYNDIETR